MTELVRHKRTGVLHLVHADGLATVCGIVTASRRSRWVAVEGHKSDAECGNCWRVTAYASERKRGAA